jgi:eukaryotic-like serine/threonine-protein kinase
VQLPARIGKYELEEFLGGGMSHVYRARDTVIGRTVAVKILTEAGCQDAEAKARFLAEARMAGNIEHENIISIFDFGEDDQRRPFMVMEFLRGEDLHHAIKNGHTGDLKNKLKIALQVARALEYIHEQKIIHRDIKPENVQITANGAVKLMDFGIAKAQGLAMTRAGYVLGTPYYMAPEQVTGQDITGQVDVYAFGVMLFEIMTGVKPISGDTVERIFYSILNEPLKLDALEESAAPQPVRDLIAKCAAKDPAQRPQGLGPVCAELERVIGELEAPPPALAPEPPHVAAPSRPAWLLPVGLLAVLLAAVGLYFGIRPAPSAPKAPELARTLSTPTGEMVLVPAGPFQFGEKKEQAVLPAFYVDKTEVSNSAYADFCKATSHALPDGFPQDKPDYPVVNVSMLDANTFAKWAGKRLPKALEWEKAARGADGRMYPWGNEPDLKRANIAGGGLRPVTDFADGASAYGALQMVGNVSEFVDELSPPSPQARANFAKLLQPPPGPDEPWYMIRGGAYNSPSLEGAIWDFTSVPGRWKNPNIGFRCVKDAR